MFAKMLRPLHTKWRKYSFDLSQAPGLQAVYFREKKSMDTLCCKQAQDFIGLCWNLAFKEITVNLRNSILSVK